MALASTPTLLSLDRYAQIMGINPVHFNRGSSDNSDNTVFPLSGNNCNDLWAKYSWQNADSVSWEELAVEIANAEDEIASIIGYYPAPKWIAQEVTPFERHHRRDLWRFYGRGVRGERVSVQCKFGKFIQGGQRGVTLVGTATVLGGTLVYSDVDGDGYDETATITLATTLTDACEIKVYFAGHSGVQEYEIRPARTKTIAGGNVVLTFYAWQLFDPDLWEEFPPSPDGRLTAINIYTAANYVQSVDVYREFNDFSQTAATFYWESRPTNLTVDSFCTSCSGTGCPACSLTSQDGCLHVRDTELGIVVPVPAEYDADNAQWSQSVFTICRDPDLVKLYYYAGEYDNRWLAGNRCDPLSQFWAQTIAWLATARLERPVCSCGNLAALYKKLQLDLALVDDTSYNVDPTDLANPLGTRFGEVQAWRRINKLVGRRVKGGVF